MPQSMDPMACRSFRKNHLAYLDDTLAGDLMSAAQRHILTCDSCAAHDSMVRRSLMVAKNLPSIEPSAAFQQRLQARLAECREERRTERDLRNDAVDAAMLPMAGNRASWLAPRTIAAIAASAILGTLIWRGVTTPDVPLVAMQPVIASEPVRPEVRYVSPRCSRRWRPGIRYGPQR